MSQENVEVVRALYEAWNSGDMVALREVLHPAIKYINPNDAIETGTHTGVDAYEAMVERLKDTFEEAHFDIDEFLDTGDHVVALVKFRARGRGSGADVGETQGHVWTVQNGLAVEVRWFHDPYEAL